MTEQNPRQGTTRTVGAEVAKTDQLNKMLTWIDHAAADYGQVLPQHIDQVHWVRLAQGLLRRNDELAKAAIANPASLKAALLECARLGHEPGTDSFALVPFRDTNKNTVEIVGIEQYQGEIERMYRAGAVTSVVCEIVRRNDVFSWTPGSAPEHDADWFAPDDTRGPMVGVYAYARLAGGVVSNVVVMGEAEVNKHKAIAKTKAIWDKWPASMWKKTAIHELEKWVPTSAEFQRERLRALAEADKIRMQATYASAEQVPFDPTTGEVVEAEIEEESK